jgi:hypothetical protein
MRLAFGKLMLAPAMLAATALAANTAAAESTVNVPFAFTASGRIMPAGAYAITTDTFSNLVTLRNKETSQAFTAILADSADPKNSGVTLQFDQLGASHTLRTIQYGWRTTSRLDRNSKLAEHLMSAGR